MYSCFRTNKVGLVSYMNKKQLSLQSRRAPFSFLYPSVIYQHENGWGETSYFLYGIKTITIIKLWKKIFNVTYIQQNSLGSTKPMVFGHQSSHWSQAFWRCKTSFLLDQDYRLRKDRFLLHRQNRSYRHFCMWCSKRGPRSRTDIVPVWFGKSIRFQTFLKLWILLKLLILWL